jgi:hypothetical protein
MPIFQNFMLAFFLAVLAGFENGNDEKNHHDKNAVITIFQDVINRQ